MPLADADLELLCSLLSLAWRRSPVPVVQHDQWARLAGLASGQGLAPFLFHAIRTANLATPPEVLDTLELAYYRTAATNTLRLTELERLACAFRRNGIPLLVLKGPALAETLYANLALRVIGDLDLVVPADRVTDSSQTLADLGYAAPDVEERPGVQTTYRSQQDYVPADPLLPHVELHWHLIEVPFHLWNVPMEWFWHQTEALAVGNESVRTLNREANLVYLPAHVAYHHRLSGLRWYLDLALLIEQQADRIRWEEVIAAARDFQVLVALRRVVENLTTYWPSLPLRRARELLTGVEAPAHEERLFRLLTAEPRSPLLDFYGDIVSLPNRRERAHFLLLNLFPQPTYMSRRYGLAHAWQLPISYLYRMGDGLIKLGRTVPQVIALRRRTTPSRGS